MKITLQSGRISEVKLRREEHGMSATPEHKAHRNIVQRCTNPKNPDFPNYGAKLKPCIDVRWRRSPKAFIKHVGQRPGPGYSINRKVNSKGYVPGNVEWTTAKAQARNRSTTRLLTFGDRTDTMTGWAAHLGMNYATLRSRLKLMTIEAVIFPLRPCTDCPSGSRPFLDVLTEAWAA
jgi:hypothetical protein